MNEKKGKKEAPIEEGYADTYDARITDFSYDELRRLAFWSRMRGPEFYLIGGWAAWYYHHGAGSRDIDIIFSDKAIMCQFLPIYYRENGYSEVLGPMGIERRFEKRILNPDVEIIITIDATCKSEGLPFKEDRKKNIPYSELDNYFRNWDLNNEIVKIPTPELLLLQKIKAHRDRSWEFENQADAVRSEYLKSKIWKDEYDILNIVPHLEDVEIMWKIVDNHKCRDLIEDTLQNLRISKLI